MSNDELSPLEKKKLEREARIPKPSVPVKCHRCGSLKKSPKSTKNAEDFYWRYYHCKECEVNYWCGVRHSDRLTVFTISTPRLTRIDSTRMMTGNLRNILTAGHPAVTAEYNQFLPNGKLPRNVSMAKLDAEEEAALATNPDTNEDDMRATIVSLACLHCGEVDDAVHFKVEYKDTLFIDDWRWVKILHQRVGCWKRFWFGTNKETGSIEFSLPKPKAEPPNVEDTTSSNAEHERNLDKLRGELLNSITPPKPNRRAEFEELLKDKNLVYLTDEQKDLLFYRWCAAVYPEEKPQ